MPITLLRVGAGEAQCSAGDLFRAAEVDALAALAAGDAICFVAGQFRKIHMDPNALCTEELVIVEFTVCEHLLAAFTLDLGVKPGGEVARILKRYDSDTAARCEIDKRGGHLPPVAKLQGSFAEAAASDYADGVSGAAIDLDICNETLSVSAERIIDAEMAEAEERHAYAEDLAGAHVAVGGLGTLEQCFEGVHHGSSLAHTGGCGKCRELIVLRAWSCGTSVVLRIFREER